MDIKSSDREDVQLNAFGEEHTDYISQTIMDKILDNVHSYNDACDSPSELVKQIYFHQDHPENHNIKLKDNRALIYDGTSWNTVSKSEYINVLINKSYNYIINYYNYRKTVYKLKNRIVYILREYVVDDEAGISIVNIETSILRDILKNIKLKQVNILAIINDAQYAEYHSSAINETYSDMYLREMFDSISHLNEGAPIPAKYVESIIQLQNILGIRDLLETHPECIRV
tara:strand:- start:7378 stop:8064 length:687 start_codon:yes stop_codon:yes gene_type:complete